LLEAGVIVICTGGGGIPALRQTHGSLMGVEAVVDKNVSSALLATSFGADVLLLLTDVDAFYCDFVLLPVKDLQPFGRLQDAVQLLDGDAGTRITLNFNERSRCNPTRIKRTSVKLTTDRRCCRTGGTTRGFGVAKL
jgi:hypothetical protein